MKTISIETLKLSIDSLVNVRDNTTIGLKPSEEIYLAAMEMLLSQSEQPPHAWQCNQHGIMQTDDVEQARRWIKKGWTVWPLYRGSPATFVDHPTGWKIVPAAATAEMIQAGVYAHAERTKIQINDRPAPGPIECAYNAMIRAAPEPAKN